MNPKHKFFLFKQSKNFCSAPWNSLEIWTDGSVQVCAASTGSPLGNLNHEPLEQILTNEKSVSIKQDLLNDQFNSHCQKCHDGSTKDEHFDLRNQHNPMFKNVDVDYDNLQSFKLHGISLHWENTCNFKCVYCIPEQSSSIAQEQGVKVIRNENENIDKIIDQIVQNQYQMKEIYFSGGEPLLIKNNARLLSKITNVDLPIRITSNISHANDKNPVIAELKRFKNVLWTISAEAIGERFNYIRANGNWEEFLRRLEYVKSLNQNLRINAVFFVGSAATFFETIKYFVTDHGIADITITQLGHHPKLHVSNCPDTVKQQSRNSLHQLLNSQLIQPQSNSYYNIARCEKELDKIATEPDEYQRYFDQLDQLRNTNWREVFPELVK